MKARGYWKVEPMPIEAFQVIPLDAPALDVKAFIGEANCIQNLVRFSLEPQPSANVLLVVSKPQDYAVEVVDPCLMLSLHNAQGIAAYAKITLVEYSLIGLYTGILFSRILKNGPHFHREDFFHGSSPPCLLSHAGRIETIAEMVSGLYLCSGCRRFFSSVAAEQEFKALDQLVDVIESGRISRSCRRRRAGSVT